MVMFALKIPVRLLVVMFFSAFFLPTFFISHRPLQQPSRMQRVKLLISHPQVHDWMLIMMVFVFVLIDVVIMTVYTGLEVTGEGATLVTNGENSITVSGVSL